MLISSAFGSFDPFNPQTIGGLFAGNLYADPIEIDAPIELIWKIITDFDAYPEWNPLNRFFRLDAAAAPNNTVTFGPSWGPYDPDCIALPEVSFTTRETITVWEENCCLAYADIKPGLMAAERSQFISKLPNGKVRYHTYERLRGPLSVFVRWQFGKKVVAGFIANGIALRKRAEAMAKE